MAHQPTYPYPDTFPTAAVDLTLELLAGNTDAHDAACLFNAGWAVAGYLAGQIAPVDATKPGTEPRPAALSREAVANMLRGMRQASAADHKAMAFGWASALATLLPLLLWLSKRM